MYSTVMEVSPYLYMFVSMLMMMILMKFIVLQKFYQPRYHVYHATPVVDKNELPTYENERLLRSFHQK